MSRLLYFLRETLISLRRNLLMTLAGVLTVFVSLFLFGGVLLLSRFVEHGTGKWRDDVELEIYMNIDATDQQITEVRKELEDSADVERFKFLTKEQAFEEFKRIFADKPDLIENVTPDALPTSFRVVPTKAEFTESIANRFEGRTGVDDVETAEEQVRQLLTLIRWVRFTFFSMAGVLLASSLFLIVNTIRLATFARRREIEVMKLVGASNLFVRIPFMAEGLVQGAIGAGGAFGAVYFLKRILSDAVSGTNNIFSTWYLTDQDAVSIGIVVLVVGAVIGTLGSTIGLRRFLEV